MPVLSALMDLVLALGIYARYNLDNVFLLNQEVRQGRTYGFLARLVIYIRIMLFQKLKLDFQKAGAQISSIY